MAYDKLFILTDEQVAECCLPVLPNVAFVGSDVADRATLILPAGEQTKSLDTLTRIWDWLLANGATRHSLLVNVGGGMISDLGGLAAASYMRGIAFINIPTTLLAMVDAAIGGKTAIDYGGIKNIIGFIREPVDVVIYPPFLETLPDREILSGYGEMLKHGLLDKRERFLELLDDELRLDDETIRYSAEIKRRYILVDPQDHGPRHALNLGHTVGHAIEAHTHLPHGFAVVYGLVAELYMSHVCCSFPSDIVSTLSAFVKQHYGAAPLSCRDYDALYRFMQHDKKNFSGTIQPCLLTDFGKPSIDFPVSDTLIREAIEYVCSM